MVEEQTRSSQVPGSMPQRENLKFCALFTLMSYLIEIIYILQEENGNYIAEARNLCSRSECGLKTFYLFHSYSFRCIVLLYSTLATTPRCTALTPPSFASFFFCLLFFFFFLNMPNCAGGWPGWTEEHRISARGQSGGSATASA